MTSRGAGTFAQRAAWSLKRPRRSLVALLLLFSGCSTLPEGNLKNVHPESASQSSADVYLLRGWVGLWSDGVDKLGSELRAKGMHAEVFRVEQSTEVGDAILKNHKSPTTRPLVIFGFSYGANDAVAIARRLNEAHIPVDLLVTIDPVTPKPVPANVKRCINYYQPNGVWDIFPWLRGVPLQRENLREGPLDNINIRERKDLVEDDISHSTIAANAKVHAAIVRDVLGVCATTATTQSIDHLTPASQR